MRLEKLGISDEMLKSESESIVNWLDIFRSLRALSTKALDCGGIVSVSLVNSSWFNERLIRECKTYSRAALLIWRRRWLSCCLALRICCACCCSCCWIFCCCFWMSESFWGDDCSLSFSIFSFSSFWMSFSFLLLCCCSFSTCGLAFSGAVSSILSNCSCRSDKSSRIDSCCSTSCGDISLDSLIAFSCSASFSRDWATFSKSLFNFKDLNRLRVRSMRWRYCSSLNS